MSKTAQMIWDAIKSDTSPEYTTCYGLRADKEYAVGDRLPCSYDWVDGDRTDNELSGTCAIKLDLDRDTDTDDAIANITKALGLVAQYRGSHILLLNGCREDYGEDESEVVLSQADCVAAYAR